MFFVILIVVVIVHILLCLSVLLEHFVDSSGQLMESCVQSCGNVAFYLCLVSFDFLF